MNHPVRVLVADKSSLVLGALQNWLDKTEFHLLPHLVDHFIQVADGCRTYQPDILVLAVRLLPDTPKSGITHLRREHPNMKIILVADNNDNPIYLPDLIRAGIAGYILHSEVPEMWQSCLRAVAGTGSYYNEDALPHWPRVPTVVVNGGTENDLTERELQLLRLLTQECNNKEIAEQLNISACTVSNNLSGLYRKLGVKGRLGALIWGWQVGLLEDVFEEEPEMADG